MSERYETTYSGQRRDVPPGSYETSTSPAVQRAQMSNAEALRGIQQGTIPSNVQIGTALEGASASLDERIRRGEVSAESQQVVRDAQAVLQDTKEFFTQRNRGDRIQRMFYHGSKLGSDPRFRRMNYTDPHTRNQAITGVNAARTLVVELVHSSELRSLLTDLVNFVQDIVRKRGGATPSTTGQLPVSSTRTEMGGAQVERRETSYGQSQVTQRQDVGQMLSSALDQTDPAQKQALKDKMVRILTALSRNDNYVVAVHALFDVLSNAEKQVRQTQQEPLMVGDTGVHAQHMKNDAIDMVEEFSGPGSLTNLINDVKQFARNVRRDTEVRQWLAELRDWTFYTLDHPDILRKDRHLDDGYNLLQRGNTLFSKYQYNDLANDIFESSKEIVRRIANDPLSQRFYMDLRRLVQDLTTSQEGGINLTMLSELQNILLPVLIEQLDYIPVPKVESHGEKTDYWVDNIFVHATDIIPDNVKIKTDANIGVLPHPGETRARQSSVDLTFKAKDIRAHMQDVAFWFNRKKFPKREDSGTADVHIGERGMRLWIKLRVQNPQVPPVFTVRKVRCEIDSLRIKVRDTRSNWLYNTFLKLFSGRIRTAIERAVEQRIVAMMNTLNERLAPEVEVIEHHTVSETRYQAPQPIPQTRVIEHRVPVMVEQVIPVRETVYETVQPTPVTYVEKPVTRTETVHDVERRHA